MMAFKGTHGDMTCTYGNGTYQYSLGQTLREEKSKAQRTGLHCAENPLEILKWYPLGHGNRYFRVEAGGSIDELGGDNDSQLSCTEMTLVEELGVKKLTGYAMVYICSHPSRKWKQAGENLEVKEDEACGAGAGSIAIARGKNPKVKGAAGSVLGLIKEDENGQIEAAKVFAVEGKVIPNTWYTITPSRILKEAAK